MRIGIDARLIEETGVGRYIRNLLQNLASQDKENIYIIFLRQKSYGAFVLPGKNWKKVKAEVPWHSVQEQFVMPFLYSQEHVDLLHVPYFNVPVLYVGKTIVTIHDLIILHFDTGKASTLPWILYKMRRFGYRMILSLGLKKATHIIAVSQATKKEIMDHYHIAGDKISVTYEGVDSALHAKAGTKSPPKVPQKTPYFLYVGNAYPHKNLEVLVEAFRQVKKEDAKSKLILVGANDFFYRRLSQDVKNHEYAQDILFFGKATEDELAALYRNATALIFPSRMEGFGLPALEALSFGCPVICSDIPVFHELLGSSVLYFPPQDAKALAAHMRGPLKRPSFKPGTQFDWATMASETLQLYERCYRL